MPKVDLNKAPYYDDFDEAKNYHRILFRPSFAVQARELTQAQSILQNQVKRSADYFLQDGDYVVPGELIYDVHSRYVCIVKNQDVSDLSSVVGVIVGEEDLGSEENLNKGVRGRVLAISEPDIAANHPATLFVSIIRHGGYNGEERDFREDRELFIWNEDGTRRLDTIGDFQVGTVGMGSIVNGNIPGVVGATSLATVKEGVYYVSGHMVNVETQTIVLDKYTSIPSYKVGLNISYEFVDEIDDSDLLDNATGAPNYLSPGSHRLKIDLLLGKKTLYSQDVTDFVELLRVDQGNIRKRIDYQLLGTPVLQGNLAERTYDESGNYVVDSFNTEVREYSASLTDHLSRKGVTIPPEYLYNTDEQKNELIREYEDKIAIGFDPGKAYVKGHRVKTHSQTYIDVDKARDTKILSGGGSAETKFADYGNYILVNNLNELNGGEVDIVNSVPIAKRHWRTFNFSEDNGTTADAFPLVDLYSADFYPKKIGTARLRDIQIADISDPLIFDSEGGGTDIESEYRVYLFDISMDQTWDKVGRIVLGEYKENCVTELGLYQTNDWIAATKTILNDTSLDEIEFDLSSASSADYNIHFPDESYNYDDEGELLSVVGLKVKVLKNEGVWDTIVIEDGGQGFVKNNRLLLKVKTGDETFDSKECIVNNVYTNEDRQEINLKGNNASSSQFDTSLNTLVYTLSKKNIREANGVSISSTRQSFNVSAQLVEDDPTLVLQLSANQQRFFQNVSTHSIVVYGYYINTGLPSNNENRIFKSSELDNVLLSDNNRKLSISSSNFDATDTSREYTVVCNVVKSGHQGDGNRKDKSLQFTKQIITPEDWVDNTFTLDNADVLDYNFKAFSLELDDDGIPLSSTNYTTSNYAEYILGTTLTGGALKDLEDEVLNDVSDLVTLNTGQESEKYGLGSVTISESPISDVILYYHYLDHQTGDYMTVQSYPFDAEFYDENDSNDYTSYNSIVFKYENIVDFVDKKGSVIRLADSIDFRPLIEGLSLESTTHLPSKCVISFNDLRYYQYRIDKVYIDTDGEFRVKRGIPADSEPPIPDDPREGMSLCLVKLSPYTYSTKDVEVTFLQNRRYTMKDIANLEKRIDAVEYYSSLSMLENMTNNLDLGDSVFKNGFFVDGFLGHNVGDTKDSKYSAAIDSSSRELRPMFDMNNLNLSSAAVPSGIVYMDELEGVTDSDINLRRTVDGIGNITTSGSDGLSRALPTTTQDEGTFYGVLKLSPSSDDWKSLNSRPEVVSNKRGLFNSVEDVEANKSQFTIWNEWEKNWSGLAIGNDFESETILGNIDADELTTPSGSKTETREILGKTVVTNYTPFIREQRIDFESYGLLAGSQHKIYIDDYLVEEVFPVSDAGVDGDGAEYIQTDDSGSCKGYFIIPNSDDNSLSSEKFRTGTRKIRIENSTSTSGVVTVSSVATADFTAIGIVAEDWIDSIKIPEYVPTVAKTGLYQEFKIGSPLFLKGVRLFFKSISENSEIYVEIRTSLNGKPGDRILPFSEKRTKIESDISSPTPQQLGSTESYAVHGTSTDDTAATAGLYIEFDQPIYLPSNNYMLVISSSSESNVLWINNRETKTPEVGIGGLSELQSASTGLVDSDEYICAEFYKYQFDNSKKTDVIFKSDPHDKVLLSANPLKSSSLEDKGGLLEVYYPNHGFEVNDYVKFSGLKGRESFILTFGSSSPTIVGEEISINDDTYYVIGRPDSTQLRVVRTGTKSTHIGISNQAPNNTFEYGGSTYTIVSYVNSDVYFNGGVEKQAFESEDGHVVLEVDNDRFIIRSDNFDFNISGTGPSTVIEDEIYVENPKYKIDVFNFLSQEITPSAVTTSLTETLIRWQYRIAAGSWVDLDINSNIYLDDSVYLESEKLELKAILISPNKDWTPMIDTERLSVILVRNRINSVNTIKNSLIESGIGSEDIGKVRHVEIVEGYEGSGYKENEEYIHSDSASFQIINITDDASAIPDSSGLKLLIPSGGVLGYEGSEADNEFGGDDQGELDNIIISESGKGYEQGDQLYLLKDGDSIVDTDVARIDVVDVLNEDEYYLEEYGSSSYITKKVQLRNTANSILVLLDGVFPGDSSIKVYCRTELSSQTSDFKYREVTYRSNINNVVDLNSASASGEYVKDIKYELNQLPNFDLFNIKILFSSSSTTKVPKVKNLRVIATTEM